MIKLAHLSFESLGYHPHTNRELGLMLRGVKPLAAFADVEDMFPEAIERYLRMFDRHVTEGRFVRRDDFRQMGNLETRYQTIYFALPSEEWRIDEMIHLRNKRGKWNEEEMRREGTLLGYEDWQNDIWASRWSAWIAEERKTMKSDN